jgi:2-polyprenyl-3-methyl-5-hydroxy-6-metoxy-1,4-benzoquinol methylase
MERYVIRGGRAGYERLQLLARDRWPDTRALIERAGVTAGMRCIDLGCGGGAVTAELAQLVAPDGFVTGVDVDEVKLALAQEAARARGITNVAFRALNINEWHEPAAYDVVFSRFLLQHLHQPVALLQRMWAAVRPGGVIIVEDADFDGWCCQPANEGFAFFLRTYSHVLARAGGDHTIGRKLYRYALAAGIPAPHMSLVCPLYTAGEGKALALSTLEATTEPILAAGIATADHLHAALQDLAAFTADPHSLIAGPRLFQLWTRREAA